MRTQALFAALAASASLIAAVAPANAAGDDKSKRADIAKPADQKVCVEMRITGSMLPKRECHTRAEWIDMTGADPSTPKRK